MKISAFITITNPEQRGDLYKQCYESAAGFCDEVIVIDGKDTWPKEFDWPVIGQHFQKGYEQATGDWVIHLDCDFIFHEKDYSNLRNVFANYDNAPALSFYKYQFILPDRFNLKSRLVLAVNKKKFGDRIKFNSGGDLCQPSLDGDYIELKNVPEARIGFWNYERLIKTEAQIKEDIGRMERAWNRYFGEHQLGSDGSEESAYLKWIELAIGRFSKPQQDIMINEHPDVMIETIKSLSEANWGYSGFGHLGANNYVKSN